MTTMTRRERIIMKARRPGFNAELFIKQLIMKEDRQVKCLKCGKEGLQSELNVLELVDGHCVAGDLCYIEDLDKK